MLLRSVGRGGASAEAGAPQVRSETVVETPFEAVVHVDCGMGSLASLRMTDLRE